MKCYKFYKIEYRGGCETVPGLFKEDAIETFYNYLKQKHGFNEMRTAKLLFPILAITVEE